MTRRILAVAGALALGIVALFTLFNALKAVLGLAVIAFAGRGLMRLWHSGGRHMHWQQHRHQHHRFGHWGDHAGLQHGYDNGMSQTQSRGGVQPQYGNRREAETVVPIW